MDTIETPMEQQQPQPEQESRCDKKCRHYGAGIFLGLPIIFFSFDLANKVYVDSDSHMKEGIDMGWNGPTYFVVTALCGAIGGAILTRYPGRLDYEWAAGALGGLIGAPLGLGGTVLLLDDSSSTNTLLMWLVACISGGIPGMGIYLAIKKGFLETEQDVLRGASGVTELSDVHDEDPAFLKAKAILARSGDSNPNNDGVSGSLV